MKSMALFSTLARGVLTPAAMAAPAAGISSPIFCYPPTFSSPAAPPILDLPHAEELPC
jgi:hypothetical protein